MDVLLLTSSRSLEATLHDKLEQRDRQLVTVRSSAKLVEVITEYCPGGPSVMVIDGIDEKKIPSGDLDLLRRCCPTAAIIALSRHPVERVPTVVEHGGIHYLAGFSAEDVARFVHSLGSPGTCRVPELARGTPPPVATPTADRLDAGSIS